MNIQEFLLKITAYVPTLFVNGNRCSGSLFPALFNQITPVPQKYPDDLGQTFHCPTFLQSNHQDTKDLLQAVDTAVEMVRNGNNGIPVPDYVDENVSDKVVKFIQSYVGVVNKIMWRKF